MTNPDPIFDGQNVIVTGGNRGLGYATARRFAAEGARVLLGCRDEARGERACVQLRTEIPGADVEHLPLDLADLASVEAFAEKVTGIGWPAVDVLVNNGGVMATPHATTPDGFELQFGTNHLGHFALTGRLLPLLAARPGSAVVTVTSYAHHFGRIRLGNAHGRFRYGRWAAYLQSKLANAVFAAELHRRLEAAELPVESVAAHPGIVATRLLRPEEARRRDRMLMAGPRLIAWSPERAASVVLHAATHGRGGRLYGPGGPGEFRGAPKEVRFAGRAVGEAMGRRLWELSERLTEVRYDLDGAALSPLPVIRGV